MHVSNLDLESIEQFQNEPKMRPGAKGFISVPSVGMRLAPEILVLELFRDVFFSSNSRGPSRTRELRPDLRDDVENALVFSKEERAVVAALRGRRKQTRRSREEAFYAPAYPGLAREAWLSRKRERVITRLLLEGAFSQYLWSRGEEVQEKRREQQEAADVMLPAFLGTPKRPDRDEEPRDDILAGALVTPNAVVDEAAAKENLLGLTSLSSTVFEADNDELARRIMKDFLAVCQLERELPRLLWLRVLMTYLRLALPMWLLAHMRITVLVHGWLVAAIGGEAVQDENGILSALGSRNRHLLQPTLTPTREIFDRVREYIRRRVELNVLLYCIEKLHPDQLGGRAVTTRKTGASFIKLSELLTLARSCGEALRSTPEYAGCSSAQVFLSRNSERYRAWRDPLNKGQGKNIDEFLRVLYRAEHGDEVGGHLLIRFGRGSSAGFRVFPGQLLLQTMSFLAAKAKQDRPGGPMGGGRLVLGDIEEHFAQYGIDFSMAADARPLLVEELQSLGLLAGSPDAGNSVAVTCPY